MNSVELVESAIQQVINGSRTQYINFGEKTYDFRANFPLCQRT